MQTRKLALVAGGVVLAGALAATLTFEAWWRWEARGTETLLDTPGPPLDARVSATVWLAEGGEWPPTIEGLWLGSLFTLERRSPLERMARRLVALHPIEDDPEYPSASRVFATAVWLSRHEGADSVTRWLAGRAELGGQVYGVDEGARVYFGKSVDRLSTGELAFLGDQLLTRDGSRCRSATTQGRLMLSRLRLAGLLTEAEVRSAQEAPVTPLRTACPHHDADD